MTASVKTVAQREQSFIVQLDGDEAIGVGRVYDAALHRLYPGRTLADLKASVVRGISARSGPIPTESNWGAPSRAVTVHEIAYADRVDDATHGHAKRVM